MPIVGAIVELLGLGEAPSDSGGVFRFVGLPAGSVVLHVRKIGFRPVMKVIRLAVADSIDLDVTLGPTTYELTPIIVRERSSLTPLSDPTGFERRRRNSAGGHFITEDEIARSHFVESAQIFRAIPGLSVDRKGGIIVERGATTFIGTPCGNPALKAGALSTVVFVDGVAMPGLSVNEIPISSIKGIEVYSGPATTPPELRSSRTVCGTVVIWTK